ncbi:MAG: DUF4294 domain-containing protein [Bacteroidia bacterium]
MNKFLLIAFSLFLPALGGVFAQTRVPASAPVVDSTSRMRVYTVNGQPVGVVEIDSVKIKRKKVGKGKARRAAKRLKRYTQVRWHVHKVYPYAVKLSAVLDQINGELTTLPDTVKRRQYLKTKKKELFEEYEDKLRKMSKNQGRILVKLIHRETGQTLYDLIKDVKSGVTASWWQSLGTLYGININQKYDPDEEENWMIEKCVQELEEGGYNMVYKQYNYRL